MTGTNCKSGLASFLAWMASVTPTPVEKPVARAVKRPRVYIAGPISKGDLGANIDQATQALRCLIRLGYAPMCPHLTVYAKPVVSLGRYCNYGLPEVWCKATIEGAPGITHDDWLDVDLSWVAVSDAILRLPGDSVGADIEVAEANRLGIPVFEDLVALQDKFTPG
jgi:hypothetical protein